MKKKISMFLLAAACVQLISVGSYAAEVKPAETYAVESEIGTRSTDVIEKKYRIYKGKLQYRRWCVTKKYWVDPYWITIS